MGLMDLLSVGKTICSIENKPNRYRMSPRRLLPNFGQTKRGIAAPTAARPASAQVVAPSPARDLELFPSSTAVNETKQTKVTKPMNAIAEPKTVSQEQGEPMAHGTQAYPSGRWTIFKNPFVRESPPLESGERSRSPVQSELRLEAIKPVRNDLHDAGLELFRPAAGRDGGPSGADRVDSGEGSPLWSRITERIFGPK